MIPCMSLIICFLPLLITFSPTEGFFIIFRGARKSCSQKLQRTAAATTPEKYSTTNIALCSTTDGNDDNTWTKHSTVSTNRRTAFQQLFSTAATFSIFASVDPAKAATDCFSDCFKNCKIVAPKDPEYCTTNCKEYCDQPDREDGLSGSVSSVRGEVGILGTSTVVKGEDKPPSFNVPGLDFNSDKGKKLIGY